MWLFNVSFFPSSFILYLFVVVLFGGWNKTISVFFTFNASLFAFSQFERHVRAKPNFDMRKFGARQGLAFISLSDF